MKPCRLLAYLSLSLVLSGPNAWADVSLKYWHAEWKDNAGSEIDTKAGLFGAEYASAGEGPIGVGVSFLTGPYGIADEDVWRLDGDIRIFYRLIPPYVNVVAGYRASGYRITDLGSSLYADYGFDPEQGEVWEWLHGPIIGVSGKIPLSNHMAMPANRDLAIYYAGTWSPVLMLDGSYEKSNDYDAKTDEQDNGKGWNAEGGIEYTFDNKAIRAGYRHQKTEAEYVSEEFSGFTISLIFR